MTGSGSFNDMLDSFSEGWRPNVGDKLIGIVIGLETRTTEYGEYPIVTVRTDEGKDFAFHAYHTVARGELEKLQPRMGDRIGIAYHGPHPTKGYERYRIIITRDTGGVGPENPGPENPGPENPTPTNPTPKSPPDQDTNPINDDGIPY